MGPAGPARVAEAARWPPLPRGRAPELHPLSWRRAALPAGDLCRDPPRSRASFAGCRWSMTVPHRGPRSAIRADGDTTPHSCRAVRTPWISAARWPPTPASTAAPARDATLSLRRRRDGEVGELRHAVGFRPETHLARHRRFQGVLQHAPAIEETFQLRAVHRDLQLMPRSQLQRHVLGSALHEAALATVEGPQH